MKIRLDYTKKYVDQLEAFRRGEAPEPVHPLDTKLAEINGLATAHTFTDHFTILGRVDLATCRLRALGIPFQMLTGTRLYMTSGESLPTAYKYRPIRTRVTVERFPTGWFVTGIKAGEDKVDISAADVLTMHVNSDAIDYGLERLNIYQTD